MIVLPYELDYEKFLNPLSPSLSRQSTMSPHRLAFSPVLLCTESPFLSWVEGVFWLHRTGSLVKFGVSYPSSFLCFLLKVVS